MLNSENNFFKVCCILLLIAILEQASAQDVLLKEEEDGWIPGMLQTKNSAYFQLLQFNGYGIGWKYRGFENSSTLTINGIEWNSKKLGVDLNAAMFGIYTLSRTEKITTGFVPTENGLAASPVMRYVNMNASDFSKNITISNRFQPLTGSFQTNFIWSTGRLKKSWYAQLKLQHEQSFIQNPTLGKRALKGFVINMHKSFTKHQYLNINFWYNHRYQTKQSPSVNEVLKLSQNELYQPGWGWLDGGLVFPNAKTSKLPIVQVQYSRKINETHRFQVNWALVKGIQSVDGLDWTSVKDPRPDYYKYLPSFYKDSVLNNRLKQFYKEHPIRLQINFDEMRRVNQSNKDKRAYYIISKEKANIQMAQQAFHYYFDWTDRMQFSFHVNSILEQIEKTNSVLDLLGGNYFLNYNTWVSDDEASVFQFDINQPDQKIKEGDIWGAHYSIKNIDQQASALFFWQSDRIESSIGFGYGLSYFQREGFNQNGLFPNNSIGKSSWYFFPSQKIQWQLMYKYSPRTYIKLNSLFHQESPNWIDAFKNIAMQDNLTEYLLPIHHLGLNLGVYYLGMNYRTEVQFFSYHQKNQSGRTSFYHDFYNAFVQANYGLFNSNKLGIEWSVESQFATRFNHQLAIGWGNYTISNNPIYSIQSLGSNYPLESGNLHLSKLPELSTPKVILALGSQGQLSNSVRFGISSVFAWNRSIEVDYFRRSFLWEKKIISPEQLPNGFITNCFINKNISYKVKDDQHQIRLFLQFQNLFNMQFSVFAFEQTRYDYKGHDPLKFAPKYLQGYPSNVFLQIIYQIN
jgi:hypothetical protein